MDVRGLVDTDLTVGSSARRGRLGARIVAGEALANHDPGRDQDVREGGRVGVVLVHARDILPPGRADAAEHDVASILLAAVTARAVKLAECARVEVADLHRAGA